MGEGVGVGVGLGVGVGSGVGVGVGSGVGVGLGVGVGVGAGVAVGVGPPGFTCSTTSTRSTCSDSSTDSESHCADGPPMIAQTTSVPGLAAAYETVHEPSAPVEQSRSGLLPGLWMSLGLLGSKKNRTCAPETGTPVSSYTCAVRTTVSPVGPTPCSGERSTVVPPAARTGETAAKGDSHTDKSAAAHAATSRSARLDPLVRTTPAVLSVHGRRVQDASPIPRWMSERYVADDPRLRGNPVRPVGRFGQDYAAAQRCVRASPDSGVARMYRPRCPPVRSCAAPAHREVMPMTTTASRDDGCRTVAAHTPGPM